MTNEDEGYARTMLRIPTAMRDQLALQAKRNHRSMNGEICFQLERALALPAAGGDHTLERSPTS